MKTNFVDNCLKALKYTLFLSVPCVIIGYLLNGILHWEAFQHVWKGEGGISTWKLDLYRDHMPLACLAGFIVASILSQRLLAIGAVSEVPCVKSREKTSDHPDDILGEDATPVKIEGMESWNPITGMNSFGPGEGLNPAEVKTPKDDKLEQGGSAPSDTGQ